jgi:hypothetical protein
MNITDLLNSDLGKQIISSIGSQTGASSAQTASVLATALPVMLSGLQRNAEAGEGNNILKALQSHDGSILDNIANSLGGKSAVTKDGNSILGHIFGNQLGGIQNAISKKSGVDAGTVASIIAMAAPILMGILGKQQRSTGVNDTGGLTNILGSLLGGSSKSVGSSILTSILDQNGDGKLDIGDVASALTGAKSNQKSGGLLGGLLGGILGK